MTTAEGTRTDAEACLEITGQRPALTIGIFERSDPVRVGEEVAYDIRVTNNTPVPDNEIVVVVSLPPEMTVAAGTNGPTNFAENNRVLRFAGVSLLRPGETLTYQIRATARAAADAAPLRVDVVSTSSPNAVTANETTRIVN